MQDSNTFLLNKIDDSFSSNTSQAESSFSSIQFRDKSEILMILEESLFDEEATTILTEEENQIMNSLREGSDPHCFESYSSERIVKMMDNKPFQIIGGNICARVQMRKGKRYIFLDRYRKEGSRNVIPEHGITLSEEDIKILRENKDMFE
ncbi:hypothetical protein QTN25_002579 [Entamoeba marina]